MPTARVVPSGTMLEDGYSTLITFLDDPDISLWEKTVTPPGVEGGDKIPISTMHNVEWRTFALRKLKELTDSPFTAAYDPKVLDQIVAILNDNMLITVTMPDGSQLDFWGGLTNAVPNEHSEGSQPELSCTIVATNRNASGVEVGPNYLPVASAGT